MAASRKIFQTPLITAHLPGAGVKAVIFDLDGVLVQTAELHRACWRRIAELLGVPFPDDMARRLRGVRRDVALRMLAGSRVLDKHEESRLYKLKGQWFAQELDAIGPAILVEGVDRLVDGLRAMGIAVAMASASKSAAQILAQCNMDGHFDVISDGWFNGPPKPSPKQLNGIASQLAADPAACVVVEDAEVGVAASRAAGMRAIGIGLEVAQSHHLAAWLPTLEHIAADELLRILHHASVKRKLTPPSLAASP